MPLGCPQLPIIPTMHGASQRTSVHNAWCNDRNSEVTDVNVNVNAAPALTVSIESFTFSVWCEVVVNNIGYVVLGKWSREVLVTLDLARHPRFGVCA